MTRYNDSYRDHCGECVHYVPWPERAQLVEDYRGVRAGLVAPDGCCLFYGHAKPVYAYDSPQDTCSCHVPCIFERGSRSKWVREIKKEMVGHDR